jgi:hypothetical protein
MSDNHFDDFPGISVEELRRRIMEVGAKPNPDPRVDDRLTTDFTWNKIGVNLEMQIERDALDAAADSLTLSNLPPRYKVRIWREPSGCLHVAIDDKGSDLVRAYVGEDAIAGAAAWARKAVV